MKTKIILMLFALFAMQQINAQQQVNRAQLQKYFHDASVAKKAGDTQKAIGAYEGVLQMAPQYADAFFELGKLYGQSTNDANSVRKAIVNYEKYLQYKTDSSNDKFVNEQLDILSQKIVELQTAELDSKPQVSLAQTKVESPKVEEVAAPQTEVPVQEVIPETIIQNETAAVEPEQVQETASPKTQGVQSVGGVLVLEDIPSQSLTLNTDNTPEVSEPEEKQEKPQQAVAQPQLVLEDPQPATEQQAESPVLVEIEEPQTVLSTDSALVGRWISSEMTSGNQEKWVWSILMKEKGLSLSILDTSYMISQPEFADFKHDGIDGYAKEDNTLFNLTKNEFKEVTITLEDSSYVEVQNLRHRYAFEIQPSGNKLQIKSLFSVVNTSTGATISQKSEDFALYRVDPDYKGFGFAAVPEKEKEGNARLKALADERRAQIGASHAAQNELACLYAAGLGVNQNWSQAIRNFTESASKGNHFAMVNLGYLYQKGFGVPKDLDKSRQYYLQAADGEMGMVDALVYCGDTYFKKNNPTPEDYKAALEYYQKAYIKNSPHAILRLAEMYANGLGVEKDVEKAKNYYIRAASKQFAEAMIVIALLYRDGQVFDKNPGKSAEYLRKAASFGDGRAQRLYSELLLKGEGVPQNFKESRLRLRNSLILEDLGLDEFKCSASFKNKVKQIIYP